MGVPQPIARYLRRAGRSLIFSLVAMAAWHGTRLATESPAPIVKVRWKPTVSEAQRVGLEERHQLIRGNSVGPNSFNYDLLDSRREAIRAIVTDPAVADTGEIDRAQFRIAPTAGRGTATRWLWHRFWPEWAARWVAGALHAWMVLSLVAWIVWEEKRPIETDTAA